MAAMAGLLMNQKPGASYGTLMSGGGAGAQVFGSYSTVFPVTLSQILTGSGRAGALTGAHMGC